MEQAVAKRIKEAKERELIALETAAGEDVYIDPWHVVVACAMCEAMGMDPNVAVVEGDDTLNWNFMVPGAVAAIVLLRPTEAPEDDMLAVPDPQGHGFLLRIDGEGQLHIREDIQPGTPLFTLKHDNGDITVAVGEQKPEEIN